MTRSLDLNISEKITIYCVWFSSIVCFISDSLNQVALYAVLPLAFLITFLNYGKFLVNKYFNLLVVLYVWIFISVIWAKDVTIAMAQMKQILGSFLLCYIFAVNAKYVKNIVWLYIAYFLILGFAWHYAYNNIISMIEFGEERLNDSNLNANTLAYLTFYFTFASFILGDIIKRRIWRQTINIIFLLTIPLSFYTAILTASRQILIIQVPLIIILLYLRYIKDRNIGKVIIFSCLLGLCSTIVIPFVSETYNESYLSTRNNTEIKDDSRTKLAKDAFKVGVEHFPLGVGPGNYRLYSYNRLFSHNTYLELFANEGIVGLFIYINILFIFLKRQWKRYKKYKDKNFLSFFTFGIFFSLDGIFYSFYEQLWLMGFFILVASHSETYYKLKVISPSKTLI